MTNELKNVPELRFPEFDGEWEEKRFENIFQEISNKTSDLAKYPLYSLTVEHGITPKSDRYKRDFLVKKNDNFKIVELYNIVYNPMNITLGAIDLSVYNYNIAVSGYYHVLKIIDNSNVNFLVNFLKTNQMINHYKKIATGTLIEKQRVHFSEFKNIVKKFPNINEQQKIGEFFSKLDRQIELEEQKLEKLEEQKKGYMQQIFSHQLIFKDKNGAIYPEWKTLKIKDIAEILRGLTYKPKDIRVAGIRVLRSSNIIKDKFHTYKDDIFVDESVVKTPLVNKGDILITAANGSPKLVGKHAIIEKLDDESVAGGFMYILRSDNSKFIQIWMSTVEYKRIISRVQGGNGSIGNLSRKDLENGYITLPCDEEQNKIGSFFNKFDELIEKQNKKIDGLKERKKGFLQKMFV